MDDTTNISEFDPVETDDSPMTLEQQLEMQQFQQLIQARMMRLHEHRVRQRQIARDKTAKNRTKAKQARASRKRNRRA